MALNIEDEKIHDAVRQLAKLTGESQEQAVAIAVNERLAKVKQEDLADTLLALGRRTAERMTTATAQLDHGELLYDRRGRRRRRATALGGQLPVMRDRA